VCDGVLRSCGIGVDCRRGRSCRCHSSSSSSRGPTFTRTDRRWVPRVCATAYRAFKNEHLKMRLNSPPNAVGEPSHEAAHRPWQEHPGCKLHVLKGIDSRFTADPPSYLPSSIIITRLLCSAVGQRANTKHANWISHIRSYHLALTSN
jgi:hypothetical protein